VLPHELFVFFLGEQHLVYVYARLSGLIEPNWAVFASKRPSSDRTVLWGNFAALWRPNRITNQPIFIPQWKADFLGYPSTYKSPYKVSKMSELFKVERVGALKF